MDFSICCIKECNEPSVALGLCVNHWRLNKKYGSPVAQKYHSGSYRGKTADDRFAMMVRKTDSCWNWIGGVDKDGYGMFRGEVNGQALQRAHRFSWATANKLQIPKYMHICHKCDNPKCVNPEHLFAGDALTNMQDKIAKGRANTPRGEDVAAAKITEEQAYNIIVDPRPFAEIASDFGVTAKTVSDIKNRASWAHVKAVPVKAKRVSPRKGVSDWVNPEMVREIRSSPLTGKELAAKFGLSQQHICGIRKRRAWAHIE